MYVLSISKTPYSILLPVNVAIVLTFLVCMLILLILPFLSRAYKYVPSDTSPRGLLLLIDVKPETDIYVILILTFYKCFNLHYGTLYYKVNLICLYVNKFNFQNYYFYICEYLKHLIYIKNLNYFCLFSSSFYVL